jgi:hypothetical protein
MNINPEGKGGFRDHPEHIYKNKGEIKPTTWRSILKRLGDELTKDDEGNSILLRELICRALYDKAKDDPRCAMTIMDREEGKPEQIQIHEGGENPVSIIVEFSNNGQGKVQPDTKTEPGNGDHAGADI